MKLLPKELISIHGGYLKPSITAHFEYAIPHPANKGQPTIHLYDPVSRKQLMVVFPEIGPGVTFHGSELRGCTWAEPFLMKRITTAIIDFTLGLASLWVDGKELSCKFTLPERTLFLQELKVA